MTVRCGGGSIATGAVLRNAYCGVATGAEGFSSPPLVAPAAVRWLVAVPRGFVPSVTAVRRALVDVRGSFFGLFMACVTGSSRQQHGNLRMLLTATVMAEDTVTKKYVPV